MLDKALNPASPSFDIAGLDGDDAIAIGYEAAAPWLLPHCRADNELRTEPATREAPRPPFGALI